MKTLTLFISIFCLAAANRVLSAENRPSAGEVKNIYSFTLQNIDGKELKLDAYKNKVLLIVNTASKCGFTPQYKSLMQLYDKYKDQGLVVIGFPANEFGGQEPGTNEEIKTFCTKNYDVKFPMSSKVVVKGDGIHPLFQFLTSQENPDFTGEIKWNFEKFLINREGKLIHRFRSKITPDSDECMHAVEAALKKN